MRDLFDEINLDLFDEIELPIEDKVIFSKEMGDLIREELRNEIAKIPMGRLISKALEKERENKAKSEDVLKASVIKEIGDIRAEIKKEVQKLKREEEDFVSKMKNKYDDLRSQILNQPRYEFGGFSPQFNDLNIGDPSIEGAWRVVKSGTDLQFQRLESGVWTLKGSFTP